MFGSSGFSDGFRNIFGNVSTRRTVTWLGRVGVVVTVHPKDPSVSSPSIIFTASLFVSALRFVASIKFDGSWKTSSFFRGGCRRR